MWTTYVLTNLISPTSPKQWLRERELDEAFLLVGVHVNLEADNGDDIEELPTPVEEQSRLAEKRATQP